MKPSNIQIKAQFDLCTGCGLCQQACSFRLHNGYNPHYALIRIEHAKENLYHSPVVCHQCRNPYCANVCPVNAIGRNANTGALTVDRKLCVGCNLCHLYCPIGMVGVDPIIKKSVKCDLCDGDPLCVKVCPSGALEIVVPMRSFLASEEETSHG